LAGSGVGPSRSLREMDHSNTASMDALHDEMSMPLKSIMLVLEYEGLIGRNSGSIALRYTDAARIGAVPVQGLKFRVFAAPLPRAVASISGCMGAAPTNHILATSRSTRTTVLTRVLCVYDTPCRSTAPWRAGITAEGFDTSRVFAAPLPRAVASIVGCMGATPTNPTLATSSSTRTTVLTWGLCVYDPPC
jgi:hypothetical protein